MDRFTPAERRALLLLLALVLAVTAWRWGRTTLMNRQAAQLPPAREAPPEID